MRTRARESTLACTAYLVGPGRPRFVYTVTPKVYGATIVDGALPSITGQGPPFLDIQDLWQVALSRAKMRAAPEVASVSALAEK